MTSPRRYVRLYFLYLRQFLLTLVEYRVDFLFGVASMFLRHLSTFVFIALIYRQIPAVRGYTFPEAAFIFGFSILPQAVLATFFPNLTQLARFVRLGELDRLLLRPLDPLFQLAASRFDPNGLGNLLVGGAVVGWAWARLGIPVTATNVGALVVLFLAASAILVSIHLVVAALAFIFIDTHVLSLFVTQLNEFASYPLPIFARPVRLFLTYALPFAFTAFFPAAFFLNRADWLPWAYATPAVAIAVAFGARRFFDFCLERYESVGN